MNMISNCGSHSLDSAEKDMILSENEAQFGVCSLQDGIGDGCKRNQGHGDESIQIMKKSGESDENCERSYNLTANFVLRNIQSHGRGISQSSEKYKTLTWKEASTHKLWDGCLKLNSSVTVSTVAFFKSGEKMPGVKWSDTIEVKGKVKLEAFEKYIQDLPRSRNRGLMVVSLRWKEGSSKFGLLGMKKIAKGYKEGERVGIAQLSPGIDLYVCPRNETIITILAKHGFFKGKTAIEENKDSLIGCVVWRRNKINQRSVEQKPERCTDQVALSGVSTTQSILEPSRGNHTVLNATPKVDRNTCTNKSPLGLHNLSTLCNPLAAQSTPSISPSLPTGSKTPYLDPAYQQASVLPKLESLKDKSGEEQPIKHQKPVLTVSSDAIKQTSPILDSEDLPEFDFGISCGTIPEAVTDKGSDSAVTVDRKLPEKRFSNMSPIVMQSLKSQPTAHHRRMESTNCQEFPSYEIETMPPQKKFRRLDNIPMLTSLVDRQNTTLRMPCSTPVAQHVRNLFDDDNDIPEWCPPDVSLKKQQALVTSQSSNTNTHSKPNSVLPFISVSPNPFPSSASVAAEHPPFVAETAHFSVHRPIFNAKQAQARPTNLCMAKGPSYPPFRPDSCLANQMMPSSQGFRKGWMP